MYLYEKYGIHHYLYEYFVRDVIIFIITLSQRCYFTYNSNAGTHTHKPVPCMWCEDIVLTVFRRLLFDFHYLTIMVRPPTHANVQAALHLFVWSCSTNSMHIKAQANTRKANANCKLRTELDLEKYREKHAQQ